MKRNSFKTFFWFTALVGCSGLLTAIPQSVIAQTNSSVLVQQSDELEEAKRLNQQVIQLYQQGKYDEAISIAERVLEMRKKLLGQEHLDVAISLNNLAGLYKLQGRYQEAEPLYKQSLEMIKKRLGEEHPAVVTSLNNLASLYESQGRYEEAEPLYLQSLEIFKKRLGEEHPSVANSLNNLAGLYESQGRYEEAELLYKQALEMRKKLLGQEHPSVAQSLNNLAGLYKSQGRYEKAELLYKQALDMYQKLLGPEHPSVATSLNNLASLYESQGRYKEAEVLYKQSLEMINKLLGEEHLSVATSLNNLAGLYESQGRYEQAELLYLQSLDIFKKLLGEEHPSVALSLNNLALLYSSQGRYEEGELLYKQALDMYHKLLGEEHPSVATSLNNLASLYESQGRYEQAEPLYNQALEMRKKLLGEEHPDVAVSLNNLAGLYKLQGRYKDAEPLYKQALEMTNKLLGQEHPSVATSLNNLASLYESQGRYKDAEPLYKQSLEMRKKLLGQDHPSVAASLNNLAGLYKLQGRYKDAEPLYKQALEMTKKLLGEEHPDVATSLNNLAVLYRSQGRYDEAEPLYKQALEMRKKLLGQDHPDVALSLNNLAVLYQSQGRYEEAEPLYLQSLEMTKKLLGQDHPDVALSLNNLAVLYQSLERYEEAMNFLNRGLDVEEQNLNVLLATGSERQKQDSMKTISKTTNAAISLHIKNSPNNSEAARLALTTLLRRKGRILDVVTNDLQLLRENITPENQQLLDELQLVRTQFATLIYNKPDPSATLTSASLSASRVSVERSRDAENIPLEQYRQQVDALRKKADNLEAELSRRSAEFRTISEPVTIEAVQQLIPEDAALVEFVLYKPYDAKARQWGKPHYAAYILKSSGTPQWVDLGEADAIHQVAFGRLSLHLELRDKKDAFIGNTQNIKQAGRKLDEVLMKPIREKLGDVKHIIISPDAELNRIPFAALVDENNQYLIENYQITYLTTGRDLIQLKNEYPHRQNPVIVANPNYDNPGQPTTVPVANNRGTNQLSRSVDPSASLRASMSFGALPGTAEEAKVISALLPNVTVFTESEATENAIKQVEAPEILHIATHGFFLKNLPRVEPDEPLGLLLTQSEAEGSTNSRPSTPVQENPLLRSGLALAGFNPRESGSEDGVLTALEVANLRLRGTKLVVLSACETGLGEIENGEGVYGLRRAFTLAGAESQPFDYAQG